ncbi:MAG: hypothetical protein A2X59_10990 [Nitrospirae bacterium GWC2_42_7]|nr:MAG: hypothetical protein A2X59_10990 [Nitrospirae bacterium GWC2_42_7]
MKNYYYILGVHNSATVQEIKSAYRKLAVRLHPDKNSGDKFFEERFKDIKEAYETLSDDLTKNNYDIKLRLHSRGVNHDELKKYQDLLKRKYKEELKKREEDIKKKYRTLEQNSKDEAEKRKKWKEAVRSAEESKRKNEKQKMLNEIESYKKLLLQKDQRLKSMKQKLLATEEDIIKARKDVSLLISEINKHKTEYADKRVPGFLQENPEILKELVKIKSLVSRKDMGTFIAMVLQYAGTRSLSSKYGREHPHLVHLILKDTVRMRPFKMFYAKHKNDPKTISDLKKQLLFYFDHSRI